MLLFKKLYRTIITYKSQFISMILMTALGVGVFVGMNGEWVSLKDNSERFFDETNYADYWLYSKEMTGFSDEDIENVRSVSGVESAVRRLEADTIISIDGKYKTVSLNVYDDYEISKHYITAGADYDAVGEGIWLNDKFAELNNISLGDNITLYYGDISFSADVDGLIKNPEYLYAVENETQIMPDYGNYGYAFVSPDTLEDVLGYKIFSQILIKSDLEKKALEDKLSEALPVSTLLLSRNEQASYMMMQSEIEEGETMGNLLPVVFFLIAVLTMITTMKRVTVNEKLQIGTLKALGFRDNKILRHYSYFGMVIGVVGVVIGIALGFGIVAMIISPDRMEGTCFDMPYWKLYIPWWGYIITLLTVVFLTFISYLSTKDMLKGTAAQALRSATPKKVKKLAIEKTKLWEKLSFGTVWNIRDILRSKLRSFMSLFGVFGCVVLLVAAFGMKDTMRKFIDLMYDEVCNYNYSLSLAENADNAEIEKLRKDCNGDLVSSASINIDGSAYELDVFDITHDYYRFLDKDNKHVMLSDDGVYLCIRLADKFGLSEGDTIRFKLYGESEEYEAKVAGVVRSLISENISMTAEYARELGVNAVAKYIYTNEEVKASDYTCVSKVETLQDTVDSFDSFMAIMFEMIAIIAVAAVILGVVVLYNLGVMSYTERYREFATLKVVGFSDRIIGRLMIKQNMWITIAGIIIGIPGGVALLGYLMTKLATEYEVKTYIGFSTYVFACVLTLGVSLVVSIFIAKKNKYIDMVEAMKGIE